MNYLLDTHALIWFLNGDKQISTKARKAIESDKANNFISIASIWEIGIKISLNRLSMNIEFSQLGEEIQNNGFEILPISFQDISTITSLPFHHRDPFDRLIISQAINANLTIVSKDEFFPNYDVKLLW
jgi:PIN domain nuclease of toxin-antitoxin system